VWDDHEFADKAFVTGAQNHDPATQGDWNARKNAAAQAYHEWLPTRTLISPTQQAWLLGAIGASPATWQLIGNQQIMARLWFPASILNAQAAAAASPTPANLAALNAAFDDFLTAKATRAAAGPGALTPAQSALLSTATSPRLPYNLDSWDGYPANREVVLQTVKSLNKRLVVLSGDSHNAWFNNFTTLAGEKAAVEFAGTSVSAPGFEGAGLGGFAPYIDGSALVPQLGNGAVGAGLGLVDDVNFSETRRRGYLMITVAADSVKGEYVFVSTEKSTTYTASVGRTLTVSATRGVGYA